MARELWNQAVKKLDEECTLWTKVTSHTFYKQLLTLFTASPIHGVLQFIMMIIELDFMKQT